MTGYLAGERLPGSEKLFTLADELGVRARWLVFGDGPKVAGGLVDAADADWIHLPRYDLANMTESAKGPDLGRTPIRRDWLNRRVGTSRVLWLTELRSDYPSLGFDEGDVVICSDIARDSRPEDGWTCFFLDEGGPFVGRYSRHFATQQGTDRVITPSELLPGDIQPIARIHARMLTRV